jgi:SelR domain
MATRHKAIEAKWSEQLTPEQYEVLRRKGTERPFTGKYVDTCGGWPSPLLGFADAAQPI